MGAGLYLIWPAFYTDVSDSYRLSRGGRLRVDLGGLYFNAVFSVGDLRGLGGHRVGSAPRPLRPPAAPDGPPARAARAVRRLPRPGRPGRRARPLRAHPAGAAGLVPFGRRAEARALKPWARAVITAWVLLVVPILALLPPRDGRDLPAARGHRRREHPGQWRDLIDHWAGADLAQVALGALAILAIALPVAGVVYLVVGWPAARHPGMAHDRGQPAGPERARARRALPGGCARAPHGGRRASTGPIARDEELTLPAITRWVGDAATGDFDLDARRAPPLPRAESARPASSLRHDVQEAEAPSSAERAGGRSRLPRPAAAGRGTTRRSRSATRTVRRSPTRPPRSPGRPTAPSTTATRPTPWRAAGAAAPRPWRSRSCWWWATTQRQPGEQGRRAERALRALHHPSLAVQLVLPLEAEPDAATRAELEAIWARADGIDDTLALRRVRGGPRPGARHRSRHRRAARARRRARRRRPPRTTIAAAGRSTATAPTAHDHRGRPVTTDGDGPRPRPVDVDDGGTGRARRPPAPTSTTAPPTTDHHAPRRSGGQALRRGADERRARWRAGRPRRAAAR